MKNKLGVLEEIFGKNRIRQNELMSKHTTFKIGGPAEFYLEVAELEDLIKAVKIGKELGLSIFVLGIGSNILVSNEGIKGLIIKNNCRRFDILQVSGRVKNKKIDVNNAFVFAEAGVIMNQLVRFTIDQGLEGLEYQLGLPGTVGGAVFMNSNFPQKKSQVGDSIYSAKVLTKEGEAKEVDNSYFNFNYDSSILQKNGEILLSVVFRLKAADKKKLWEKGMDALKYRDATQPKGFSAGCIFKNISIIDALNVPTPGRITSVGYLIDKAGLKGRKVGDAMISLMHANFIINLGKATANDVMTLIGIIKEEVFKKFRIKLALEIKTVGF